MFNANSAIVGYIMARIS